MKQDIQFGRRGVWVAFLLAIGSAASCAEPAGKLTPPRSRPTLSCEWEFFSQLAYLEMKTLETSHHLQLILEPKIPDYYVYSDQFSLDKFGAAYDDEELNEIIRVLDSACLPHIQSIRKTLGGTSIGVAISPIGFLSESERVVYAELRFPPEESLWAVLYTTKFSLNEDSGWECELMEGGVNYPLAHPQWSAEAAKSFETPIKFK